LSVVKTLVVPAIISLIIFLVLTYLLVPIWRRYRNRYSQYLPIDTLSERTSSFRYRIQDRIRDFIVNTRWRRGGRDPVVVASEEADFMSDGEELEEVVVDGQTNAAGHRRDGRGGRPDNTRRLSRELEEGFMDDSDEEEPATARQ